MIERIQLEPIEIVKEETLYRVPVIKTPDKYEVFIGKKYLRIFNDETLPNFIKSAITMAQVATQQWIKNDADVVHWEIYTCRVPNMEFVGWRVSDSLYVVVINEEQLTKLKGERHD